MNIFSTWHLILKNSKYEIIINEEYMYQHTSYFSSVITYRKTFLQCSYIINLIKWKTSSDMLKQLLNVEIEYFNINIYKDDIANLLNILVVYGIILQTYSTFWSYMVLSYNILNILVVYGLSYKPTQHFGCIWSILQTYSTFWSYILSSVWECCT